MTRRVHGLAGGALLLLSLVALAGSPGQEAHENNLRPGPFPPIPGAVLGPRVSFENEVQTSHCHPILVSEHVVGWIAAAHSVDGRLFIRRCHEWEPRGANDFWEEARPASDTGALVTSRLDLPDWSVFSNAAFCEHLMAYWGFRGDELIPAVFDLRQGKLAASRSHGDVILEADHTDFLPRPAWNRACSEATFDGARVEKPAVTLRVPLRIFRSAWPEAILRRPAPGCRACRSPSASGTA